MKIEFNCYRDIAPIQIPDEDLLDICETGRIISTGTEEEIIKRGIENPTGTPPIGRMVSRRQKVLIIADDNTRTTPTKKYTPLP